MREVSCVVTQPQADIILRFHPLKQIIGDPQRTGARMQCVAYVDDFLAHFHACIRIYIHDVGIWMALLTDDLFHVRWAQSSSWRSCSRLCRVDYSLRYSVGSLGGFKIGQMLLRHHPSLLLSICPAWVLLCTQLGQKNKKQTCHFRTSRCSRIHRGSRFRAHQNCLSQHQSSGRLEPWQSRWLGRHRLSSSHLIWILLVWWLDIMEWLVSH